MGAPTFTYRDAKPVTRKVNRMLTTTKTAPSKSPRDSPMRLYPAGGRQRTMFKLHFTHHDKHLIIFQAKAVVGGNIFQITTWKSECYCAIYSFSDKQIGGSRRAYALLE